MDSSRFSRIETLFHAALEKPPQERRDFLTTQEHDTQIVAEVERLLARHAQDPGFLDDALDAVTALPAPAQTQVGPYRILGELGAGGMGAVFLAERLLGDTPQKVALKLIRGIPTVASRERLARERALLAELNHPNIARLLDAGETSDRTPYLAMEYVEGAPLLAYCDERALDLPARLRLFVQLCRAAQHAHQRLIVHRDIKPANILVREDGTPVLLDFGIGKLIDPGADEHGGTRAFTPAYAAPEQRSGGRVTTATDVYGLGGVLHELVSGRSLGETRVDDRVTRPSAAARDPARARLLRGDLDNIAMKALDVEPERRYVSAEALAEDVENHLRGRPVAAHAPTRWYRAGKFIRRHRGGVTATALLTLAVFAALAVATWQAHLARQQAARADAVRDFVVSLFESAGADLPLDKRPTTQDIVDRAARQLPGRSDLSDALRVDLLLTLAKVARSVGATAQGLALLDAAAPALARLYGPADAPWWNARILRAGSLVDANRNADALAVLDPLRDKLIERDDGIGIDGLIVLGTALSHAGKEEDGLALLHRARELASHDAAKHPEKLLDAAIRESGGLIDAHRFRDGIDAADAALALWRKLGAPPSQGIIALYQSIAIGAEAVGDMARAEAAYKDAIAYADQFFDKPNAASAWNVGMYGTFLIAQGRLAEAEPWARRGLEMRRAVFGDADPRTLYGVAGMGKLYLGERKFAEAAQWFGQGVDTCRKAAIDDNVCPRLLAFRARAWSGLARFDDAERDLREALELQKKRTGDASPAYAFILDMLVVAQAQGGKYEAAIASADRVLAIDKQVKGAMLQSELTTRYWRASALFALRRVDEASNEMIDIEPKYAAAAPKGVQRFNMLALKARALAAAGRSREAADAAQAAVDYDAANDARHPDQIAEMQRIAAAGHAAPPAPSQR
ncbi:MAG: serine/threonine-protein kinase [Rudaea sp.]|uniref:protein kinase domain-containing protein n=1 Tax=Rudaea sp. TaxID=2136325 RepID=UPI0039E664ED